MDMCLNFKRKHQIIRRHQPTSMLLAKRMNVIQVFSELINRCIRSANQLIYTICHKVTKNSFTNQFELSIVLYQWFLTHV